MGPWLHPTGAWEGIIRLKLRAIILVGMTQVRWGQGCPHQLLPWVNRKSLLRALPAGAAGGRRNDGGERLLGAC